MRTWQAASPAHPQTRTGQPVSPRTPFPCDPGAVPALTQPEAQARAALITAGSYDVFLDLTASPARSRAAVRFRCAEPGATSFADIQAAAVRTAVLNGTDIGPPGDGRLPLPRLAAENVLTVEAEVPDGALTTFTDPSDGAEYVLACPYPTGAELFCCFDQPDMPAPLALALRAPAGWSCVASGAVQARPATGEAGTWRFAPARMRPMDIAFFAGPLTETPLAGTRSSMALRARAALPDSTARHLERCGEVARDVLEYYEQLLRVPCPDAKHDIVAVPGLPARAFACPGLMMVNEDVLAQFADSGDDSASMIVGHEAAHWWVGGLVSARWWDDLWLEESLATYLSYASDAGWAAFGWSEKPRGYLADLLPTRQPVSSPVATMAQALDRPNAITYVKGTALVRQLAALIGAETVTAGLTDYLTLYAARGTATLDDLVACWSRASGRDLADWAGDWLRTSGTPVLKAELSAAADGTIGSLTVTQDPPRAQRVGIGLFDREGGRLRRRRRVMAELSGTGTVIPGLAGEPLPDAIVVNDGDWAFAHVTFDGRTLAALADAAMDVGDPLAEVACWNAAWHMVLAGELAAADFTGLVTRRLGGTSGHRPGGSGAGGAGILPATAAEALLARAITCADRYAPGSARALLREQVADAALAAAREPSATPPLRGVLLAGFAGSAQSPGQLALLRQWLDDQVAADLPLRGKVLGALSARGLAGDGDLDSLTAADPVAGEAIRAICRAMRPDPAAKETAWTASLAAETSARIARAHAEGIWVPGQAALMEDFADRYFRAALPALSARDARGERLARRLARLLYPATLDAAATVAATDAALAREELSPAIRAVLIEEAAALRTAAAARKVPPRLEA